MRRQICSAKDVSNALGLNVHLATAGTGETTELISGPGPEGKFDTGYSNLSEASKEMTQGKESHHFYPVLFYLRFSEPFYSVLRFTLAAFDTVTLIKSALDDKEYAWLKESGAVSQLCRASMLLVTTLAEEFLPDGVGAASGIATSRRSRPQWNTQWRWMGTMTPAKVGSYDSHSKPRVELSARNLYRRGSSWFQNLDSNGVLFNKDKQEDSITANQDVRFSEMFFPECLIRMNSSHILSAIE